MFYRYFYDQSGNILLTATIRSSIDQPLRAVPLGPTETYIDDEQLYDAGLYQVDLTTNTLVPKNQ